MKKLCPKCRIEKEYDCFSRNRSTSDGYQVYCRSCVAKNNRKLYDQVVAAPKIFVAEKRCEACRIVKDRDHFGNSKSERDGLCHYCRECVREMGRRRAQSQKCAPKISVTEKRCSGCDSVRDISAFSHNALERDGHARYCKECTAARNRETRKKRVRAMKNTPIEKCCSDCGQVKPCAAFDRDRTMPTGLSAYCKECRKLRRTSKRARTVTAINARKYRAKHSKSVFTLRWWTLRVLPHSKFTMQDVKQIAEIFEKDSHCEYCGFDLRTAPSEMQLDHRRPKARGGRDCASNIAIACATCNGMKRTMTDVEFKEFLKKFVARFSQSKICSFKDYLDRFKREQAVSGKKSEVV